MKKLISASLLLAATVFAGTASANLIVNGSFEDPAVGENTWIVAGSGITGWDVVSGAGIEIRNSAVGEAYAGENFIELDSDPSRGGTDNPTNTTITQTIQGLEAGLYELTWAYSPRINVNGGIDGGFTNGIVAVWNESSLAEASLVNTGDGGSVHDWVVYSLIVEASGTGLDTLSFAAFGDEDKLGGSLDDVKLSAVPLPAAVWLFGSALLGFVGFQKRKKA